jgi:hypothetical protein
MNGGSRGRPVDDQPQLFPLLDGLIGRWCDRRELGSLRVLLQGYPLVSPLSDGWHELRRALQTIRASGRDTLPAPELEDIATALRLVERALRKAGQLP